MIQWVLEEKLIKIDIIVRMFLKAKSSKVNVVSFSNTSRSSHNHRKLFCGNNELRMH